MDVGVAVGLAVLGVLVAETLEALRLYTGGDFAKRPAAGGISVGPYLTASAIRIAAAALVAVSLATLGLLCNETLAFLAGLSTLKVMEILVGYSPGR